MAAATTAATTTATCSWLGRVALAARSIRREHVVAAGGAGPVTWPPACTTVGACTTRSTTTRTAAATKASAKAASATTMATMATMATTSTSAASEGRGSKQRRRCTTACASERHGRAHRRRQGEVVGLELDGSQCQRARAEEVREALSLRPRLEGGKLGVGARKGAQRDVGGAAERRVVLGTRQVRQCSSSSAAEQSPVQGEGLHSEALGRGGSADAEVANVEW